MEKSKNKSVISSKNTITLIIVLAICILLFIIGLCSVLNRYFDNKQNREDGLRPTFYADEKAEMDIVIPTHSENNEISSIDYKVSLQNKHDVTSVCRYNLYYYWDENPNGYYRANSQDLVTLTGILNDQIIFDNIELKDYNLGNLKTLLASYYIVNDGSEITNQTWHITSYYQNGQISETITDSNFPGSIGVEEVLCTEAEYLKDQNITKNNNYICLNSRDEFCAEEDLYEIIGQDEDGIKVVRTKAFGISSWNNDLLPRLEDAFFDTDGKYIRGMVLDHSWSLYDESDLNASINSLQNHEKEAENKVVSKVGLLSLSDYKTLNSLKKYNKPYLLLSDTGLVFNIEGALTKTSATGYVYPVLYLNPNAVVSKGDGSWGNPYFVN